VRLRDVANVEYGPENDDVRVTFNGEEGVFLGVFGSPGANALDTSAAVEAQLPQIQRELPPGMVLELVYDATDNISSSIEEVFTTITEAVIIVVLVILLFPRLVPLRAGADPDNPAVADRRLLLSVPARLFHQPPDPARHGARHRAGGG
jgi:multidrug efflux pump subunit AcrB